MRSLKLHFWKGIILLSVFFVGSRRLFLPKPTENSFSKLTAKNNFASGSFILTGDGEIDIPCQIGQWKGYCVLDTGADQVLWRYDPLWKARVIKPLPSTHPTIVTLASIENVRSAIIPQIQLLDHEFRNVEGFELGSSMISKKGIAHDLHSKIILGNPFWQSYRLLIDYETKKIFLYDSDVSEQIRRFKVGKTVIPIRTIYNDPEHFLICIEMKIENKQALICLDTGASKISIISSNFANAFTNPRSQKAFFIMNGAKIEGKYCKHLRWTLETNSGTISVASIPFGDKILSRKVEYDGIISPLQLGITRMLIHYPSHQVYLEFGGSKI